MEISTLSTAEIIQIYSSFVYITTDALNCNKTLERATPQVTANQHNCKFHYPRKVFELDGITWNSCLCRFLHPNFNELMIMNKHYANGLLPHTSLLDTPNIVIERLELLDHLKALHQEHQQKEAERKHNGANRHRPPTESGKRPSRPPSGTRPNKPN